MRVRVLGSAAGGGFPQWNCGCAQCAGLRAGTIRARPRTQASIAVGDGDAWFLFGASPDVRGQIESFPALHPRAGRDTPIAGIVLANGDLDHVLGLLSLRESQPLALYATAEVRRSFLDGNALARTLARAPGQSVWNTVLPGESFALGALRATAVAVPGKPPLHADGRWPPSPGDNVGYLVRAPDGRQLGWFPCVAGPSAALAPLRECDVVFFDGTFYREDELPAQGLGSRGARAMAHWPLGGGEGSLAFLASLPARRRIYVHVNNTNPILREDSPERAAVAAAGVEVAEDGMEIEA